MDWGHQFVRFGGDDEAALEPLTVRNSPLDVVLAPLKSPLKPLPVEAGGPYSGSPSDCESRLDRLPYFGKLQIPSAIVPSVKPGDLAVGIAHEPDGGGWHHERIVERGP